MTRRVYARPSRDGGVSELRNSSAMVSHWVMTLIDEVIASRLPPPEARRAIRLAAGVAVKRFAAEVQVHRTTLIRWENGTQEPRGEARQRYAQLLNALRTVAP